MSLAAFPSGLIAAALGLTRLGLSDDGLGMTTTTIMTTPFRAGTG